ncbi:hypothetical protein SNEBB_005585 [Seison nebaliae]|nr:hypothetical protein SNEBB_005585 [Seison nebaliae]
MLRINRISQSGKRRLSNLPTQRKESDDLSISTERTSLKKKKFNFLPSLKFVKATPKIPFASDNKAIFRGRDVKTEQDGPNIHEHRFVKFREEFHEKNLIQLNELKEEGIREKQFHEFSINLFKQSTEKFLEEYKSRRGNVEFIFSSLDVMKDYGIHRYLDGYRYLIDLFPEGIMVPETMWQREMGHFPKHQDAALEVLERMNRFGLSADRQMLNKLIKIFGDWSTPVKSARRQLYWVPKFQNQSPYPIPFYPSDDPKINGKICLERMQPDKNTSLELVEEKDCWIMNAQSIDQRKLLQLSLLSDEPSNLIIRGPFTMWMRYKEIKYFTLTNQIASNPIEEIEDDEMFDEFSSVTLQQTMKELNLRIDDLTNPFHRNLRRQSKHICRQHELENEQILAMSVVDENHLSKSINRWINLLKDENPLLNNQSIIIDIEFVGKKRIRIMTVNKYFTTFLLIIYLLLTHPFVTCGKIESFFSFFQLRRAMPVIVSEDAEPYFLSNTLNHLNSPEGLIASYKERGLLYKLTTVAPIKEHKFCSPNGREVKSPYCRGCMSMCLNGGRCAFIESPLYDPTDAYRAEFSYYCVCPEEYGGANCTYFTDFLPDYDSNFGLHHIILTSAIPLVYIAILLIITIGLLIIYFIHGNCLQSIIEKAKISAAESPDSLIENENSPNSMFSGRSQFHTPGEHVVVTKLRSNKKPFTEKKHLVDLDIFLNIPSRPTTRKIIQRMKPAEKEFIAKSLPQSQISLNQNLNVSRSTAINTSPKANDALCLST